jgi:hypothetical protein
VKELWKPFRHGHYEVSNLGRVRRAVDAVVGGGAITTRAGFIMKLQPRVSHGKTYLAVVTCYHGRYKGHWVHKLVARAFIGPCPRGKEVNHKDLNPSHNCWDNLEYLTHKNNIRHAAQNGAMRNYWTPKLTHKQVKRIRKLRDRGYTIPRLARKFKVSEGLIKLRLKHKYVLPVAA